MFRVLPTTVHLAGRLLPHLDWIFALHKGTLHPESGADREAVFRIGSLMVSTGLQQLGKLASLLQEYSTKYSHL